MTDAAAGEHRRSTLRPRRNHFRTTQRNNRCSPVRGNEGTFNERPAIRKVKSPERGEPWPRSCKTCRTVKLHLLRPYSGSSRPFFRGEVQPALPTEARNRGTPFKNDMCAILDLPRGTSTECRSSRVPFSPLTFLCPESVLREDRCCVPSM